MAAVFRLHVLTPESTIYDGAASSVEAPATLGYLEVLANHAPLVTGLTTGLVTIKDDQGTTKKIQNKAGGFLHVLKNDVTLFLDPSATLTTA